MVSSIATATTTSTPPTKACAIRTKITLRKRSQNIHRRNNSSLPLNRLEPIKMRFSTSFDENYFSHDNIIYNNKGSSNNNNCHRPIPQRIRSMGPRNTTLLSSILTTSPPSTTEPPVHRLASCDTSIVSVEERADDNDHRSTIDSKMLDQFCQSPTPSHQDLTVPSSPPPLTRSSRTAMYMQLTPEMSDSLFLPDDF